MTTIWWRIALCRLIEKMEADWEYSEKLGLENASRFQGMRVVKEQTRMKSEVHENGD